MSRVSKPIVDARSGDDGSDHAHVDVTDAVLCFCTRQWFTEEASVREFVRAILRKKPLIALLEPHASEAFDGCIEAACREILASDEFCERLEKLRPQVEEQWANEWGQPDLRLPTAQEAADELFKSAPLVWMRSTDVQDVTMRMIGERMMPGFTHLHSSA